MRRNTLPVCLFLVLLIPGFLWTGAAVYAQSPPRDIRELDHCCIWKSDYDCDYAPSGMPDFDQKRSTWGCAPGLLSWCGPTAAANCTWWFDSKYDYLNDLEPLPFACTTPPAISDLYPLVTSYGVWDDHDPANVAPLITDLAMCMDTDGITSGGAHCGTILTDMFSWLSGWYAANTPSTDPFCVELYSDPCWDQIEEWTRCSEDVILLLGF